MRSPVHALPRRAAMGLLGAGLAAPGRAAPMPVDVRRLVFVPGAAQPVATVLDSDADTVTATLPLGLVPRQVVASSGEALLAATDGVGTRFVTADMHGGALHRVALPHAAERLVMGTTGWVLGIADLRGGAVTLWDLRRQRAMGRIEGLPGIRDLAFGGQDGYLYVAAEGRADIGVIDVNTAAVVARIALRRAAPGGIAALTRTPDGRRLLVRLRGDGPASVIDLASGTVVDELPEIGEADGLVPSGTGAFLFAPDSRRAELRVLRADAAAPATVLRGAPAMLGVHSAWLDSVAFVPSAARRRVLVYDLDTPREAGEIVLPGTPGPGAVTADSRKLYLPLSAPHGLAVIDGQTRRLLATLPLPDRPLAAIVPGGWGLCH